MVAFQKDELARQKTELARARANRIAEAKAAQAALAAANPILVDDGNAVAGPSTVPPSKSIEEMSLEELEILHARYEAEDAAKATAQTTVGTEAMDVDYDGPIDESPE